MLEYAYGYDREICAFVARLIPRVRERGFPATARAIGVVEGTELIAGLVYHNWEPEAGIIEISGAALPGRRWLSRETIKRMYRYPFHDCGCQMVVQRSDLRDTRLLRMLAVYGYHFITIPRMLGRDKDGVLCCLTYEAWAGNRFNARFHHDIPDPDLSEAAE
jgi:hypothetical protein